MSAPDPLESLFQAGRAEVPSAAAKAKAAAALGVGAGAAGTTAVAAAGTGVATVLKVGVAIAVVGGGAFVGGLQLGEQRTDDKYRAQIAELQKKLDEKPPPVVVVQPPPAPPEPVVTPEPTPEPKPVVKPPPVAPKEEDTLKLELAALDRVRTRMRDDDFDGALKELAAYEKRFPTGAMGTEASLMRIEALLKAGRRDEAEALGKRVLDGPGPELMKQRVRRLLNAK